MFGLSKKAGLLSSPKIPKGGKWGKARSRLLSSHKGKRRGNPTRGVLSGPRQIAKGRRGKARQGVLSSPRQIATSSRRQQQQKVEQAEARKKKVIQAQIENIERQQKKIKEQHKQTVRAFYRSRLQTEKNILRTKGIKLTQQFYRLERREKNLRAKLQR